MGEEQSEQLEFIPVSIKLIEHIRPRYSCRHCEQHGIESKVKITSMPSQPLTKSIATASLLSQIIASKYQYALPLYRQEPLFKQYGIKLNRKSMAEGMIKSSQLPEGMYQRLKTIQLKQAVIHADETPVKVIHANKCQCYMWFIVPAPTRAETMKSKTSSLISSCTTSKTVVPDNARLITCKAIPSICRWMVMPVMRRPPPVW